MVNRDSFSPPADAFHADAFHTVVRNARGQCSLWPTALQVPAGWQRLGEPASRADCAAAVDALWTRLRPVGPGPAAPTVPRLLAERARGAGERIAVVSDHDSLSYAQLEHRADRLARRLRRRGVGPESVVTVFLERSPAMVVGLLAVLKAGGAFLPVAPDLPARRLAQLIEDSSSTLVLTSRDHAGSVTGDAAVLLVDEAVDGEDGTELPDGPDPDDLAYMIYTSGSTGAPKGVMVDHRSFARVLLNLVDAYGLRPEDRVMQLAALGFDTSLEQIFTTLLGGGTLVLAQGPGWAPTELTRRLREHGITVADLTPSYWHRFLAADHQEVAAATSLRLLIVGGDTVQVDDCRRWLRRMPGVQLVNAYGLTETTITSTLCHLDSDVLAGTHAGPVPIGSPLPDTSVQLLDSALRPVPTGRRGEIFVGGCGVARGFWRRPGLTAEAFLPDPYAAEPGGRMYRTGDAGRWRPDGRLEFLGRIDDQVKIRGYRVDPAEVEVVLTSHQAVGQAAAVAVAAGSERELVAFYTTMGGSEEVAEAQLRSFLAESLPGYMLPTRLTAVEELPLDRNGKVDRRRLSLATSVRDAPVAPVPVADVPAAAPALLPTGDPAASVAAGISQLWAQLLDLERVGDDDDFFQSGGNSLLAMEMLARVRIMFGIGVTQLRALTRALLEDAALVPFVRSTLAARAGTLEAGGRVDFAAESRLQVPVNPASLPPPDWRQPADILLTGATGFCGTHLLDELLRSTGARIHCLIRARDVGHAVERLRAACRRHLARDPLGERSADRIVPVVGDLAEPLLGLDRARFEALADRVDLIYHCGGQVNFIYPYREMSAANIAGTREVVRLAGHSRAIPLHYLSSMAVLAGYGAAGVRQVTERSPLAHPDHLAVGYVEGKWVAEALLQEASAAGLPVAVYRLNDVTGDQRTGVMNTGAEWCALIKFIVDAGCSPAVDLPLDFLPADCFARALLHISTRRQATGETYHLTNPRDTSIGTLVERIREFGYPVEELPFAEWVRRFAGFAAAHPNHPMTSFLPLFVDRSPGTELTVSELYFRDTFPVFSRDNAQAALAGSGIDIPPVDGVLLDRYLENLLATGYLAPPRAGRGAAA
ncbi:amino acid adenylation domain-containing protein/thioester reductase-like protein [Kitasatospora sp. MAA4]|uniref:amino acid adenylation domain-containing protein n=1 Tax=Kitasatospora sp. MAA4 TaxID=3035093 RepID=UPI0024761CD5|nr:amino acid adenylation domain-containing protein [Kitasatospora sp. MAA4]MDH6131976.1 amino acid adenylation domain-containing protein/thioester reductase-like protein [Kitasatospora sp. MAA4]